MSSLSNVILVSNCKGFSGSCDCKLRSATASDMGECSEYLLARAVLSIVVKDITGRETGSVLRYRNDAEASLEYPSNDYAFDIRCDGSPLISSRWRFEGLSYYTAIYPLIHFMFATWIRANPDNRDRAGLIMRIIAKVPDMAPKSPEDALATILRTYSSEVWRI
ncbi:hypothetical protein BJX65DRAFT_315197 [Aspergillus insuetus]